MANYEPKTCEITSEWAQYICSNSPVGDLDDFIFQGEPTDSCSER